MSEKTYKIFLTYDKIMEINNASIASVDHNVWEYTNTKGEFQYAEPVTPKSVTTEPIAVKTSSEPIHST